MARRDNPYSRPDARTRSARAQGYPARSVFKLEEIDKRVGLLGPGQRVLELGAAPGSWTLYAASRVGSGGRVLAVDLNPIDIELPPQVEFVLGDAFDLQSDQLSRHAPYDVVLSDMAPNTSGNKVRDQARSFELFMRALDVASSFGKAGSAFVAKLFMSGEYEEARQAVRRAYASERTLRPRGTRQESSEVFILGTGKRA